MFFFADGKMIDKSFNDFLTWAREDRNAETFGEENMKKMHYAKLSKFIVQKDSNVFHGK